MYYETKEGDDELCRLFDKDNEEEKPRKRRRNEASILEQENDIDRLSNSRPKRAAGTICLFFELIKKENQFLSFSESNS